MPRSDDSGKERQSGRGRRSDRPILRGRNMRRLKRLLFQAKLTLYIEKLWPHLWPFIVVFSLSTTVILFDLLPKFSPTIHFILLLGMMAITIGLLVRSFVSVKWPSQIEALHRLETDSGFKERPLSVLMDRPVHSPKNKVAQSIWVTHVKQTLKLVPKIRLSLPVSYLGKRDKYSFRAGLIILLLLGFIESRNDRLDRIERAFTPIDKLAVVKNWNVEIWVTPPEHTGLRPVYLELAADYEVQNLPTLEIAQHSHVIMRIDGVKSRHPVNVTFGSQTLPMSRMDGRSFSLETKLGMAETITFLQNRKTIVSVPVDLKADLPPQIVMRDSPQKGLRGHLNVAYKAADDYGLSRVRLEIDAVEADGYETLKIEKHLSGKHKSSVFRANFADHPWAGREVIMTPVVRDNFDQQVYGKGIKTTLPVRTFNHPLAQRLVNVRKELFQPTPSSIIEARTILFSVLERPQDFENKVSVYLPLRVALDRMRGGFTEQTLKQIRNILWESAVHLDEGNAGNARDQLEMLSRQMFDMMQLNSKSSEMEQLFEQMSKSLERYMQQMAQSMPMMEGFENIVAPQNMEAIGQDELQSLLDRARDMMRAGDMEGAQALLNQFQSILSRLAMQKPPNEQDAKMAGEIMKKLQTIVQEQQKLLDMTFQRVRSSEGPSLEQTRQAAIEAEEQKMIAGLLSDEMKRMLKVNPHVPENLKEAHVAMTGAAGFLETGRDESAIQAQTEALEKLIEGMQQSANQMAQQLGMQSVSRQLPGFDPMGRGTNSQFEKGSGFEFPTETEVNKSREVLQELYRRAGQKGRTQQELEYIDRLLEPF